MSRCGRCEWGTEVEMESESKSESESQTIGLKSIAKGDKGDDGNGWCLGEEGMGMAWLDGSRGR